MSSEIEVGSSRVRRERTRHKGRVAALDKLKQLKGSKHKYEVAEMENVYEEVDEKEYSKRVQERQDDDWIIDDDGTGYVEDGREIFDDDMDDESIIQISRKKKRSVEHGSNKRARLGGASNNQERPNSIRNMLMKMPAKKEVLTSLEEDDILGGIMEEIHGNSAPSTHDVNNADVTDEKCAEETALKYLKNFIQVKPKAISQSLTKQWNAGKKETDVDLPIGTHRSSECNIGQENDSDVDVGTTKTVSKSLFSDTNATTDMEKVEDIASQNALCATMFQDDFMDMAQFSGGEMCESNLKNEGEAKNSVSTAQDVCLKNIVKDVYEEKDETLLKDIGVISSESFTAVQVSVDPKKVPLLTNAEGQQVLRFFWLDAYEEPFKQPGVIFLFGKVWIESAKEHVSCCLTIRNVERKILVLPKEKMISDGFEKDVTFLDVYNEFSTIASQYGIMQFRSRKVEMHNCFTPEVPHTSEYMEIKYHAQNKVLPENLSGHTFSHVFGIATNALERFLVERRIKGPCWLDVHGAAAVENRLSWCKVEASVEKMEMVAVTVSTQKLLPPPVVLLALHIKTVMNPKNSNNEIALVVGLVNRSFPLDQEPSPNKQYCQHFSILAPLSDQTYPYDVRDCMRPQDGMHVERMESERALLSNLLAKVQRLDPDLVVGHDVLGFDLEVLLHQLLVHKVPSWSRLGRLRRLLPSLSEKKRMLFTRSYLCGRLPCDVMLAAKEHVQNVRSYDLQTLCTSVLEKETHSSLTFEEVRNHYASGEKLKTLLKRSLVDAVHALQIMCRISAIPLALQITNIAGNVMSRTLIGGRAERNEFLMLHAFHEKSFIPPEKSLKKSTKESEEVEKLRGKGRKKPNYSGGLVLEPKKGLYDKMVLVMDFNSLYPSIIMEYNICFTTVCPVASEEEDIVPEVPSKDLEIGILPAEIRKLVESRSAVRKLMQDSKLSSQERGQLQIRQIALKLMANSMYGCLGFSNARFYAKHLAALITAKGREILMNTKELVESMNYEVIYGDTDSIMINTSCPEFEEVIKIGKLILQSVNKQYQCVNLDIDGVFKFMLLLKKKKYAVMEVMRNADGSLRTKIKHKGLDIVRRDWSRLAIECGNFVVEQILSDMPLEDRLVVIKDHLKTLSVDLKSGKVPLLLLTISKQLTKSIEQYPDAKSQPHVLVAKRLLEKGMCRMKAGDTVSYVICDDGTSHTPVQRAYHLDELKDDKTLKVDYRYYLAHQIHPVINRLLDPVEGIDSVLIAESLGLDPSPYQQAARQHSQHNQDDPEDSSELLLHEPETYERCEKFSFMCVHCKTENVMDKPYRMDAAGHLHPALSRCSNLKCSVPPSQYLACIQNRLTLLIRHHLQLYSKGVLVCEDPACPQATRFVPQNFQRAFPICTACKSAVMYKQITDRDLFTQLLFYQMMFNIQSSADYKKDQLSLEVKVAYEALHDQVTGLLEHSFYSKVDLGLLFKYSNVHLLRNIKTAVKNGIPSGTLQNKHCESET